jgi:peptidoglycan L-alanyl-D-glutamate endopeptidase CwlK
MSYALGPRSLERLVGVHPDLRRVVERAIGESPLDFTVLEGLRTVERQKVLFAKGATRTMNSRHLTGHAVDLAPVINGAVSWDWPLYNKLAFVVFEAAKTEGVPLTWGGHWKTFADGPHFELPWDSYPK